MKINKASILKWIGEGLLIFLSIIGAFWVENYRESTNSKKDYISCLVLLRNEIHSNIRVFRSTYDNAIFKTPFYKSDKLTYTKIVNLLGDKNIDSDYQAFQLIYDLTSWTDFRIETNLKDEIYNYSRYIREDSLHNPIRTYAVIMTQEFDNFAEENNTIKELKNTLEDNLDIQALIAGDSTNETFTTLSKNREALRKIKNLNLKMLRLTREGSRQDSLNFINLSRVVKEIDSKLVARGYQIDKLSKEYLE